MPIFVKTVICRGKKFLKWDVDSNSCSGCCFNDNDKYFKNSENNFCDSINAHQDCDYTIYTEVPLKEILSRL